MSISATEDPDVVLGEVHEALCILHAIEDGALLADAPPGPDARRRHRSAVALIDILRAKLEGLEGRLEAAYRQPRQAPDRPVLKTGKAPPKVFRLAVRAAGAAPPRRRPFPLAPAA